MAKYIDAEKLRAENLVLNVNLISSMKYIDAALLRKDIDNWKKAMADAVGEYSDGVRFALEHFTFVLDSFQQEQQEVDLKNEYQEFCKDYPFPWSSQYVNREYIDELCLSVARHFYGLRNRALEEAARHVYESWMGGAMNDVRRDMVELGKVLNARKED